MIWQILFKILITVLIISFAIFLIISLWKKQINIKGTIRENISEKMSAPLSWIKERDKNSLYQNEKLVAKIEGTEEYNNIIKFREINKSNQLDINLPFRFKNYTLKIKTIGTMTGFSTLDPEKGRILSKVETEIVK